MAEKKGKDKFRNITKALPLSNLTAIRIKQLRKEAGYTSAETFAFQNGFNRSQYIAYEKGVDLRLSTLERICIAHKISLGQFFAEGFE